MAFSFDKYSSKSGISQYEDFLDNQVYLHQLKGSVRDVTNYQLLEIRKSFAKNSAHIQGAIEHTIKNVCGTLETGLNQINTELHNINQGLDDINWQLTDLNAGIADLHYMLDWKTDLIIEQQKIANNFLGNIAKAAFLPDKKKENIYYNKIGDDFLKKAIRNDPNCASYSDGLEAFNEAYKADKFDYFCLSQLGFIYLNSRAHTNIPTAKKFFSEASKYALTLGNGELKKEAAAALYYESVCNYILNDISNAKKNIWQAMSLNPLDIKYKFQLAKYMAASGREEDAAILLRDVIEQNKKFGLEAFKDDDLITKPAIQSMLNDVTKNLIKEVDATIDLAMSLLRPQSQIRSKLEKIIDEFNPKTFITACEAKEKLNI